MYYKNKYVPLIFAALIGLYIKVQNKNRFFTSSEYIKKQKTPDETQGF